MNIAPFDTWRQLATATEASKFPVNVTCLVPRVADRIPIVENTESRVL